MTVASPSEILYEVTDRVAVVTLNRPDQLNAWTHTMQRELAEALDRAAQDPDVGAIVLTGAGRGFCAGADMEVLSVATEDSEGSSRGLFAQIWCPKPIIAAINGPCAGIGLQLALMCDIRFAAASAKFTTAFARRGLIAEHGLTWLMPRITNLATSLDLLLSARVFLGSEAASLGIVNAALDSPELTLEHSLTYARDLAANVSPTAMAVIKWQLYNHLDSPLLDVIDHSDELMNASIDRADLEEGVASIVEGRTPRFPPLDMSAVPGARGDFRFRDEGALR